MKYNPFYKPFYQSKIIYKFIKEVFPVVNQELHIWRTVASDSPEPVLSQQALASIEKKAFHAQGGSIYSLYTHQVDPPLIKFIVALQTISDYLDNLCDRVGLDSYIAFLQLHKAMTDALDPSDSFSDYYAYYPYTKDGGYLHHLVNTCKEYVRRLPKYALVQQEVIMFGQLYAEMQSYKHVSPSIREEAMNHWAKKHLSLYPDLSTWEFAAAAGSTLGIFVLCALASDDSLTTEDVQEVKKAYFPWICGLHILLDYFIDQKEDLGMGDLNFVSYYRNSNEKKERLQWFLQQSLKKVMPLKNQIFHLTVIEGLLAMYFSDPKASLGEEKLIYKEILKFAPYSASVLYMICRQLRRKKIILC
ncbi:tetraprenyl-beta-curcumene synthase family protein [Thermotalea metallivorans]|uniref:Tetraprenyl-beta-curcumene synthase n=1 Tax=Thermotalea metallivorans TaxID=520762 RepID=A0A140LD20_9FIRM|nr:tetraprenyl-beta-curcumene synthase family protein [Thermotalea metallivorans]KXG78445.1 Tetraprenyl-beta-curcumene synthase [Thermotalea metallivorans]